MGYHPEVSVLAAEKRYQWFMGVLCSDEGGPLGIVQDEVVKKRIPMERSSPLARCGLNQELLPPIL